MRKPPMTPEEIGRRRDEIVESRGPWRHDNLRLAKNVYTMKEGAPGREARVRLALQWVADLTGSPLPKLRVLDLACGEGGFALELGRQGAEVVALEANAASAEKASFARDALGLHRVTVLRAEARRVSPEEHGFFDVVLALGILERLDAPALFEVAKRMAAVCKRVALIESRVARSGRGVRELEGIAYRGAEKQAGGQTSFLLTRESTLGLLSRYGFTSIVQMMEPDADGARPCFAAFKGRRVSLQTAPQANAEVPRSWAEPVRKTRLARLLGRTRR
jgi:SAM-dependent methyltransferase